MLLLSSGVCRRLGFGATLCEQWGGYVEAGCCIWSSKVRQRLGLVASLCEEISEDES